MLDNDLNDYLSECASEGHQSSLERSFIREYLRMKGYQIEDLRNLPRAKARQLMIVACNYASLKLAEIESRAKFRATIQIDQ